jgi:hypothetical protein
MVMKNLDIDLADSILIFFSFFRFSNAICVGLNVLMIRVHTKGLVCGFYGIYPGIRSLFLPYRSQSPEFVEEFHLRSLNTYVEKK